MVLEFEYDSYCPIYDVLFMAPETDHCRSE